MLVGKMLGNVLLDSIVGSIPLLGNVFDLFYKANSRNLDLMREYYDQGKPLDKHRGSVWPAVMMVVVTITAMMAVSGWIIVKLFRWISE